MRHVSTLREHIIQIAKPLLSRLLFVLDVSVHLLALTVDVSNDLPLVRNPGLLLFHETIRDALDLRSNRIQSIVMVLDPVLLLLDQSRLKLIPTSPSPSIYQLQNSLKKAKPLIETTHLHPFMVVAPGFPENFTLFIELAGQILA